MPHFTHTDVLDAALESIQSNANKMVLTNGEPTSFTNANTNNGSGSGQKISEVTMVSGDYTIAAGDNTGDRKITSAAKSAQAVIADGDGSYIVYLDTVNSKILHYYPIATPRTGLTTADSVNFPAHSFTITATEEDV